MTRRLTSQDPRSLCPLSSTELVEPLRKKILVEPTPPPPPPKKIPGYATATVKAESEYSKYRREAV
jgi:hypothetical protein